MINEDIENQDSTQGHPITVLKAAQTQMSLGVDQVGSKHLVKFTTLWWLLQGCTK